MSEAGARGLASQGYTTGARYRFPAASPAPNYLELISFLFKTLVRFPPLVKATGEFYRKNRSTKMSTRMSFAPWAGTAKAAPPPHEQPTLRARVGCLAAG